MLTIHVNGTRSHNSMSGGFAGIIEMDGQEMVMFTGGDPDATSNRMELAAVIEGFRILNASPDMSRRIVTVRTNSRLIVDAFNQRLPREWQKNHWRTEHGGDIADRDLWEQLVEVIDKYVVTWRWAENPNADVWTKRCTMLAVNEAAYALKVGKYWVNKGAPLSIQARRQARKQPRDY